MNRYLSTAALYARSNLYKVLLITLVTALLAAFLVYRYPVGERIEELGYTDIETGEPMLVTSAYPYLDDVLRESGVPIVCAAGYGLMVVVMSLTGCGYGVKTDYTVRRLRVKERTAFFLWSAYHGALLVIFWAVLAVTLYGMLYLRSVQVEPAEGEVFGQQTMMLLCYTDTFLHHLIPLRDIAVWGVSVASVVVTAMSTVQFSRSQRQGKFSVLPIFIMAGTMAAFFCEMGNTWNYILLAALGVIGYIAIPVTVLGGEEDVA